MFGSPVIQELDIVMEADAKIDSREDDKTHLKSSASASASTAASKIDSREDDKTHLKSSASASASTAASSSLSTADKEKKKKNPKML